LLKPAILVALLFRIVFAVRLFDEVWVLTRGGPNGATETISILLYRAAFEVFDVSRAGALSILLLAITACLAWVLVQFLYRRGES
jgi:multiple sugar transport system permease protein